MVETITLREASRRLSRYVEAAEGGQEYLITRNGHPVARLVPVTVSAILSARQQAALIRTRARMRQGWPLAAGPLDRNALYER